MHPRAAAAHPCGNASPVSFGECQRPPPPAAAAPRNVRGARTTIDAAPTDPGGTRAHGTNRARQDPQRRRRRAPGDGQDVPRRGTPLPDGPGQPARDDRRRHDGLRLGRGRAEAQALDLALAHPHEWQGRKVNLLDCPGDPSFQGEARCALRVVEGALVVVSGVMGFEVGTARMKKLAEELGLARVLVVNMLDRERADFFRTLGQIQEQFSSRCVAVHIPIGAEHELEGIVDVLHMCAYISPDGQKEGDPVAIPDSMHGSRAGVPREAPRRGRADRRGADGALPRGRGARPARGRGCAQARRHARRALPGRLLRRLEEPRDARAPRPPRRRRPVAGQARRAALRRRRGVDRSVRLQDDRRPLRREDQPLPRAEGRGHDRHDA